jgi:hypothetical protein
MPDPSRWFRRTHKARAERDSARAGDLTADQIDGFNVALEEARLLGAEVHPDERVAAITLTVLWLPEVGPAPDDPRVQLLLGRVGRVAATLRHGPWNDPDAEVECFDVEDLLSIVQGGFCSDIYGGDFLDPPDMGSFPRWSDRLSCDWHAPEGDGLNHMLVLSPDGLDRTLAFWIWFDDLEIRMRGVEVISIDEFGAGGQRWWDGLRDGDERTQGSGIYLVNLTGGKRRGWFRNR